MSSTVLCCGNINMRKTNRIETGCAWQLERPLRCYLNKDIFEVSDVGSHLDNCKVVFQTKKTTSSKTFS